MFSVQGKKAFRSIASATLLLGAFALSGCGLQPATSYVPEVKAGSIKKLDLPAGAALTITSKNFTEQIVLGKIAVLATKAAGFDVTDLTNVPGSVPSRQLMINKGADMAWEYTGTAWLTYLGNTEGISDQQQQWQAVHDADLANGLTWLAPAPLNNTYAFAKVSGNPRFANVTKLSDLANVPVADRTFCVESEFNSRVDGFNPMLAHYGLKRGAADGVLDSNIRILDTGAVYTGVANGSCNFGEVFTTDGRVPALNLQVLDDDKGFFPGYNAAPEFATKTLEKYPELKELFNSISAKLDNPTMQRLNAEVDVAGKEPVDVAFQWLLDQGFVKA